MQNQVKDRLLGYISQNFPELLSEGADENAALDIRERVESAMTRFQQAVREGHPAYIAEEFCIQELAEGLGPSRFQYVLSVLEEEFPAEYESFHKAGILTWEVLNMLKACQQIFDELEFSFETEDQRPIRYAIIAQVHDYLTGYSAGVVRAI